MTVKSHNHFVFPDDSRWDDARQAWNLAADLRPAVVVVPTTVDEVVDAVTYLETAAFVTGEILHVDGGQQAGH